MSTVYEVEATIAVTLTFTDNGETRVEDQAHEAVDDLLFGHDDKVDDITVKSVKAITFGDQE